jgi:hypothetical protein
MVNVAGHITPSRSSASPTLPALWRIVEQTRRAVGSLDVAIGGDMVMTLLIVLVVVGQGTRLISSASSDIALDLVDSRAFPKGVVIQVSRPTRRP